MTFDELTDLKRDIMPRSVPSSGDNLEGMVVGFQRSLEQSRLLTHVYVKKTGDLNCMIEATRQPAAETLATSEVTAEIECLWLKELRYRHFEAHVIRRADYQEALDFITVSQGERILIRDSEGRLLRVGGHGGIFVTGRIAVDVTHI